MVVCLLLNLCLKAAFEFKGKVVAVDRDPLDQPPEHSLVVIRHRLLMLIQKGFTRAGYCRLLNFNLHHAGQHEPQVILGVDRQVLHQASPKLLAEVRHHVGQAFQRRDEPLELPPADAALPDFSGKGVPLRLGGLIPADQ